MSGLTSGGMQGLGATGTGYNSGGGNSLLMQLLLQHLMSGGGGMSSFTPQTPMSGNIANNPLSGLLPTAQRTGMGMNPQVQAPQTQLQGANTGSALGGGNLQSLLQTIQNQQRQTGNPQQGTVYGTPNNPTVLQGLGNLFSSGQWAPSSAANLLSGSGTPQTLQQQMGASPQQYMP